MQILFLIWVKLQVSRNDFEVQIYIKNRFYTQTDINNQERNLKILHLCILITKRYNDEKLRFRCTYTNNKMNQ